MFKIIDKKTSNYELVVSNGTEEGTTLLNNVGETNLFWSEDQAYVSGSRIYLFGDMGTTGFEPSYLELVE